jgi:hypothetical protein
MRHFGPTLIAELFEEGSAAVMAVTAAQARKEPGYVDVEQKKLWAGFGRHGINLISGK